MEVGGRDLAGERGDVDDVAAAAVEHPGQHHAGQLHQRQQVDRDDRLELLAGLIRERAQELEPGVVDEDVERPDRLGRVAGEHLQAGGVGEVGAQPLRRHPGGPDPVDQLVWGGEIGQRQIHALRGQGGGDVTTEAAGGAGNQCVRPPELHRRPTLPVPGKAKGRPDYSGRPFQGAISGRVPNSRPGGTQSGLRHPPVPGVGFRQAARTLPVRIDGRPPSERSGRLAAPHLQRPESTVTQLRTTSFLWSPD